MGGMHNLRWACVGAQPKRIHAEAASTPDTRAPPSLSPLPPLYLCGLLRQRGLLLGLVQVALFTRGQLQRRLRAPCWSQPAAFAGLGRAACVSWRRVRTASAASPRAARLGPAPNLGQGLQQPHQHVVAHRQALHQQLPRLCGVRGVVGRGWTVHRRGEVGASRVKGAGGGHRARTALGMAMRAYPPAAVQSMAEPPTCCLDSCWTGDSALSSVQSLPFLGLQGGGGVGGSGLVVRDAGGGGNHSMHSPADTNDNRQLHRRLRPGRHAESQRQHHNGTFHPKHPPPTQTHTNKYPLTVRCRKRCLHSDPGRWMPCRPRLRLSTSDTSVRIPGQTRARWPAAARPQPWST